MEVKIQKCHQCGSRNLRNILVRDEHQKVFVQCRDCENLVARYVLANGGYYHAGKDFESFLRSIERDGGASSARDLHEQYDQLKEQSQREFEELLDNALANRYGDKLP